jgi:hypothetical protein
MPRAYRTYVRITVRSQTWPCSSAKTYLVAKNARTGERGAADVPKLPRACIPMLLGALTAAAGGLADTFQVNPAVSVAAFIVMVVGSSALTVDRGPSKKNQNFDLLLLPT